MFTTHSALDEFIFPSVYDTYLLFQMTLFFYLQPLWYSRVAHDIICTNHRLLQPHTLFHRARAPTTDTVLHKQEHQRQQNNLPNTQLQIIIMLTARTTTYAKATAQHLDKIIKQHEIDVAAVKRLVEEKQNKPTVNRELFPSNVLEEEFKPLRTSPRGDETCVFKPIKRRARSPTEANIDDAPRFAHEYVDLRAHETLDPNADYWGATAFTPLKNVNEPKQMAPCAPYAPLKRPRLTKSPVERVKAEEKQPLGETKFIRRVPQLPLVKIPPGNTYYKAICCPQPKRFVDETQALIASKTILKDDFLTCTPPVGTVFFTGKRSVGDVSTGKKPVRLMYVVVDVVDKIISCMYLTEESNGHVKPISLRHGMNTSPREKPLTVFKHTMDELWEHIGSTAYYWCKPKRETCSCIIHVAGVVCAPTWVWRPPCDHTDRMDMDTNVRHIWRNIPDAEPEVKKDYFIKECVEKKLLTSEGERILKSFNKGHFAQAKFVEYLITFNEWGL